MPRQDKGSLKGLGSKYGATVRKRYTRVVRVLKAKRECPSCGSNRFIRASVGIWKCRACGYTMAGGAYDTTVQ